MSDSFTSLVAHMLVEQWPFNYFSFWQEFKSDRSSSLEAIWLKRWVMVADQRLGCDCWALRSTHSFASPPSSYRLHARCSLDICLDDFFNILWPELVIQILQCIYPTCLTLTRTKCRRVALLRFVKIHKFLSVILAHGMLFCLLSTWICKILNHPENVAPLSWTKFHNSTILAIACNVSKWRNPNPCSF